MEREIMLVSKACELVGVSKRTMYNWMNAGWVEYTATSRRTRWIYVDSLWRHPDRSKYTVNQIAKGDPARQPTLSVMKAMKEVEVSRRTIYNWIDAGKVEWLRTAGGSIRIVTDSLWRAPHWPDERPGQAARIAANTHP